MGNPEEKRTLQRPELFRRIIFRLMLRKLEGLVRIGWSWLKIGTNCGHL
jgi:hypothetical protein